MKLALGNAWVKFNSYFGNAALLQLFVIALMFILYKKKAARNDDENFIITYALVFAAVYFCPVTAYLISDKMIGRDVYWRMFWLLPIEIVIAYVLTHLVHSPDEKYKKVLFLVMGAMIIVCLGGNIYKLDSFSEKENWHKLDAEVLEICRIIEEDAAATGNETKAVATSDIFQEIREYDANIIMPYGRNAERNENMYSEKCKQLYDAMESEKLDAPRLAFFVDKWDISYVIYSNDADDKKKLISAGFTEVGEAGKHSVYHLERNYDDYWLITQYGDSQGDQMSFYTIQNKDGYTIVVDGGTAEYEDGVRYALRMVGSEVDAWIITNLHEGHVGAFNSIYNQPNGIVVKDVYTVDMPSPEKIKELADWDDVSAYKKFLKLDIENLHYLKKGDELDLGGLKLTVLNAYGNYISERSTDVMNDGSLMFKVENKKQSMLFCSDVGFRMSSYLLNVYGKNLKSDYVQMANHGNGGLSDEFYSTVDPIIAFFDAPEWLMTDVSDAYTTVEKRKFMRQALDAKIKSFLTAPNSVILK